MKKNTVNITTAVFNSTQAAWKQGLGSAFGFPCVGVILSKVSMSMACLKKSVSDYPIPMTCYKETASAFPTPPHLEVFHPALLDVPNDVET